jgi:hypothetical protein
MAGPQERLSGVGGSEAGRFEEVALGPSAPRAMPLKTRAMPQKTRAMPQKTRAMPWSERSHPFRVKTTSQRPSLKGWQLSDQGIALVCDFKSIL